MNTQLAALYDVLENQRFQLLAKVKANEDNFDRLPGAGQWSIHQVLSHLITVERLSLQYISKKIQGIATEGDTGLAEVLKMLAVKISLRLPLKFKAPVFVVDHATNYQSLDELIQSWDGTRKQMRDLLDQFHDHELRRKVYRHVVVGKINIMQALGFLTDHIHHHMPQLNRLMK